MLLLSSPPPSVNWWKKKQTKLPRLRGCINLLRICFRIYRLNIYTPMVTLKLVRYIVLTPRAYRWRRLIRRYLAYIWPISRLYIAPVSGACVCSRHPTCSLCVTIVPSVLYWQFRMLPIALSSQLFELFLFVVGMDTNTWKQVGMERTTTNSLVPFQPFQLGRMKLRHPESQNLQHK